MKQLSSLTSISNWYEYFVNELETFMERDTKQDLALDMRVMVLVMDYIDAQWLIEMDMKERSFLTLMGLFILVGVMAGLR